MICSSTNIPCLPTCHLLYVSVSAYQRIRELPMRVSSLENHVEAWRGPCPCPFRFLHALHLSAPKLCFVSASCCQGPKLVSSQRSLSYQTFLDANNDYSQSSLSEIALCMSLGEYMCSRRYTITKLFVHHALRSSMAGIEGGESPAHPMH